MDRPWGDGKGLAGHDHFRPQIPASLADDEPEEAVLKVKRFVFLSVKLEAQAMALSHDKDLARVFAVVGKEPLFPPGFLYDLYLRQGLLPKLEFGLVFEVFYYRKILNI